MKTKMTFLLLLPVALAVFWFASNSRAATETPEYKVIRTDEKFEIPDFPFPFNTSYAAHDLT